MSEAMERAVQRPSLVRYLLITPMNYRNLVNKTPQTVHKLPPVLKTHIHNMNTEYFITLTNLFCYIRVNSKGEYVEAIEFAEASSSLSHKCNRAETKLCWLLLTFLDKTELGVFFWFFQHFS